MFGKLQTEVFPNLFVPASLVGHKTHEVITFSHDEDLIVSCHPFQNAAPKMIPKMLKQWLQEPLEGLFGTAFAHQRHRNALRNRPTVGQAIATIQNRWKLDPPSDGDDPIFIFSAGWRSGSTLLQRLVLSGGDALIWGEPYPHCDYIRTMASSLTAINDDTPPDQFFLQEAPSRQGIDFNAWTACMYPLPQYLQNAHRLFFQKLYREPALTRGYARWGLKEVVLSTDAAAYLTWLFPEAKLVFLVRNPYDAYRSYRNFATWYFKWPDAPIFTARQFGLVWKRLVNDFLTDHQTLGGLLIRYEDLVSDQNVLTTLSRHLATSVQSNVTANKITGRAPGELQPIPLIELFQLRLTVQPLADRLGYVPSP